MSGDFIIFIYHHHHHFYCCWYVVGYSISVLFWYSKASWLLFLWAEYCLASNSTFHLPTLPPCPPTHPTSVPTSPLHLQAYLPTPPPRPPPHSTSMRTSLEDVQQLESVLYCLRLMVVLLWQYGGLCGDSLTANPPLCSPSLPELPYFFVDTLSSLSLTTFFQ